MLQGPTEERGKKNTNHGKILLKRRVVERVAQWQLQLHLKKEGEGAEIENETGPEALPLPGTCRGDATLETRVYLWRIFDFRISYLVLPSSVPSHPSRWQSSPCGIDILTAVLGELQQQKSLHKYLFIYATKSTLATRSAHKPPPPPWCRSGEGGRLQCVSNRLSLSSRCPHCDKSAKCSTAND